MRAAVLAIPEEMATGLRQAAVELGVSAEELAERAIRRYLRQEAERKIDREEIVYWSRHKELLERFGGRYIAMHKDEVIDSDEDEIALYVRAQSKHPTVGILIKKVGGDEEVWTVRSPYIDYSDNITLRERKKTSAG